MMDRWIPTGDLLAAIGPNDVAKEMGLKRKYLDRWGQNPDKGGKVPSMERFEELQGIANRFEDEKVQTCLDKLLRNVIATSGRIPVHESAFTYWEQIRNGIYTPRQELHTACSTCGNPLFYIANGKGFKPFCQTCFGQGVRG